MEFGYTYLSFARAAVPTTTKVSVAGKPRKAGKRLAVTARTTGSANGPRNGAVVNGKNHITAAYQRTARYQGSKGRTTVRAGRQ